MRVFNTIKKAFSDKYDESKFTNKIHPMSTISKKSNISFVDTIREICDNSLDANATKIYVLMNQNSLFVIDNGKGMNLKNLNEVWVLNNSRKKNDKSSKGCFGVGLKQSVAQLNGKNNNTFSNILSIPKDDSNIFGWCEYDPSLINTLLLQNLDGWKNQPAIDIYNKKDYSETQEYFLKLYQAYLKYSNYNHGTIVGFWNTSIPELENSTQIENSIQKVIEHLGECYFDLIQNKQVEIKVNSNTVKSLDPLLRYSSHVSVEEWEREHPNNSNASKVKFTIVTTPKHQIFKKKEPNLHSDINNANSGIYLKRNGVIISKANKSLVVTPEIDARYKEIGGKGIRECIFWNGGNSETANIRLLIECDSTWDDLIVIDQEKISFTFHPDMKNLLAEMMLFLDKAKSNSRKINVSNINNSINPNQNINTEKDNSIKCKNNQIKQIQESEFVNLNTLSLKRLLHFYENLDLDLLQSESLDQCMFEHEKKLLQIENETKHFLFNLLNFEQKQSMISEMNKIDTNDETTKIIDVKLQNSIINFIANNKHCTTRDIVNSVTGKHCKINATLKEMQEDPDIKIDMIKSGKKHIWTVLE